MNKALCACGLTEEHCIHPGCVTRATLKPPAMSMRDYFAAKAMQALLTDPDMAWSDESFNYAARNAYEMADLMLQARSRT